ncbi:hypothetical protein GYMLUDRAFT_178943 [Collybiopsis luxurians FD-317 M1]|uniref:DUF6536 domain-containing protein n=1 Tax=Collybiopsis luxurians FD-317 M1 TaxID=944289 RepID=A0A0D0CES1_9AGAR|nr:hypothetical protein GYMLUDRAFT_178943 [Collybiopsis luxurians FD-317 M1]
MHNSWYNAWIYQILPVRDSWTRLTGIFKSRIPTGWRFGAWLATLQAVVVLLLNVVIMIWSVVKAGWSSSGLVYQGDCDTVGRVSIGIHLVINVLSTLLLGASNYVMQSLCAPTRNEVDKAHARGSWLDIGVQSLRNLKHHSRSKRRLWLALFSSSIPLHLLYNSAFFSTIRASGYNVWFALGPDRPQENNGMYNWVCEETESQFVTLPCQDLPTVSGWDILSPSQCINAYATDFVSTREDVVVVMGHYASNTLYLLYNEEGGFIPGTPGSSPFNWICGFSPGIVVGCSSISKQINSSEWEFPSLTELGIFNGPLIPHVNYCLSQPAEPKCQLEFNLPVLILVIIFNFVKVVCMALAAGMIKDQPLVTVGDAIASFTANSDPCTRGMSLAWASRVNDQKCSQPLKPPVIEYQPQNVRWLYAATMRHWIWTILLYVSTFQCHIILIYERYTKLSDISNFTALWQLGIGKIHSETIISSWALPTQGYGALIASVLVANSPQLILSMIYIVFNNLCTTFFLAREWLSYASSHKPLRVSSPEGEQRSTYFLQIPYRFGLPLMAYSALLHWLVSQSIFLVQVDYESWIVNQGFTDVGSLISCGYSPAAMVLASIVAATLILSAVVIGFFKRLDCSMPLVGSCSFAISAACHPPVDGADSLKPMKWGVVSDTEDDRKQGAGHISFSSGEVLPPIPGYYYY